MFDGKGGERSGIANGSEAQESSGVRRSLQAPEHPSAKSESCLKGLTKLSSLPIETTLVGDLSGSLHTLFDHVCETTLPIYFGPLLGRLYLEGL